MKPSTWSERLLAFAFSAVVAVVALRFVWTELQPMLPFVIGLALVAAYFTRQRH